MVIVLKDGQSLAFLEHYSTPWKALSWHIVLKCDLVFSDNGEYICTFKNINGTSVTTPEYTAKYYEVAKDNPDCALKGIMSDDKNEKL